MSNSIHHVVKKLIQLRPYSISPESVTNIACIGQQIDKIGQKKVPI